MNGLDVLRVVEVRQTQQTLALAHAFFGERRGALLFIDGVVDFLNQLGNDFVDAVILVGRFFRRSGNNQRRPRFVDQDRIDFIDDGEVMAALHLMLLAEGHAVIAQVIESKLSVGAVSDVAGVLGATVGGRLIVQDAADCQT